MPGNEALTGAPNPEISVVFPAYNEEKNIRVTIPKALQALERLFARFEIIIVDDCSTDRTGALAEELAAGHPHIRVLHNERNLGQGASLVKGFQQARCRLVMHNAMDYPFDLNDLELLLPALREADIVVAARKSRPGYTAYRKLASAVHLTLLHTLFPSVRLRDYNFVQVYPQAAWNAIRVEARSTAFLTPEALIRAHDLGYRIREVETEYHPRTAGVATSGKPKVVLRSVQDMLRFWFRRLRGRTRPVL